MGGIQERSFIDGTVFFTSRITTDDGLMGTLLLELPEPATTTGMKYNVLNQGIQER
ncbi:hypothetical protein DAPPUDRAFT_241894 [Daphnia pulex]|uniref:Uncharacterized protein n=1 Tax=Daphnia pulex TaxID=6669 RepID=E9GFB4_DAPPU|nr:hypothetical protein DAPPUDRAFT_241894 [Daphnia pulex]|eukprot:EFX81609.1 hypothetical protein DAPPUDRAFT_241894 [Daphnia pulex]